MAFTIGFFIILISIRKKGVPVKEHRIHEKTSGKKTNPGAVV